MTEKDQDNLDRVRSNVKYLYRQALAESMLRTSPSLNQPSEVEDDRDRALPERLGILRG